MPCLSQNTIFGKKPKKFLNVSDTIFMGRCLYEKLQTSFPLKGISVWGQLCLSVCGKKSLCGKEQHSHAIFLTLMEECDVTQRCSASWLKQRYLTSRLWVQLPTETHAQACIETLHLTPSTSIAVLSEHSPSYSPIINSGWADGTLGQGGTAIPSNLYSHLCHSFFNFIIFFEIFFYYLRLALTHDNPPSES